MEWCVAAIDRVGEDMQVVFVAFMYTLWQFKIDKLFVGKKYASQVISEWANVVKEFSFSPINDPKPAKDFIAINVDTTVKMVDMPLLWLPVIG